MSAETDLLWEQYLKDNGYPEAVIGETYIYNGVQYVYKEDGARIVEIVDNYPQLINQVNCIRILNNQPPLITQTINESVRIEILKALAETGTNAAIPALQSAGVSSAVISAIKPLSQNALSMLGGASSMLQAINSLPLPGVDKLLTAVRGQIKATEAKLPFKTGKASDIVTKVNQVVQGVLPSDVKGPASLIFAVIRSNLLAGIPDGGTTNPSGAGSRLADEARKLVAAAPVRPAYEAQFRKMALEFPEMNINAVGLQAARSLKSATNSGNPSAFMAALPNLMKLASGAMKLLGKMSKHPDKLPQKEPKTKPAPKPKPLVEPRNLFAAAAGASSMGTLLGTVSSLMGIIATVASNINQMSPSPQTTSAGPQKLTGTANTVTWGSGQFNREEDAQLALINKELELSTKIEQLTTEILAEVDLEKITSKSMAEILEIYPQYNEGTTVIELYQAILDYEQRNAATTGA